jgi:adenylate kinase family enzyme
MNKKINLPFSIVLLGQVASGKDTQAKMLQDIYSLKPVESGKYWRKVAKLKTKEGDMVRKTSALGKPAPVSLMKNFLLENLKNIPKNKKLIFVGNPRLKPEAQLLNRLMKQKKEKYVVFYISLNDSEILRRSESRMRNIDDKLFIKKRILWHKTQVLSTVNYFSEIKEVFFVKINGNKSVLEVNLDIQKSIYKFLKNM